MSGKSFRCQKCGSRDTELYISPDKYTFVLCHSCWAQNPFWRRRSLQRTLDVNGCKAHILTVPGFDTLTTQVRLPDNTVIHSPIEFSSWQEAEAWVEAVILKATSKNEA